MLLLEAVLGVPPAQASARVDVVGMFTAAASGISHIPHRNIDWTLYGRHSQHVRILPDNCGLGSVHFALRLGGRLSGGIVLTATSLFSLYKALA